MYTIWERDPDNPLSGKYTLWGETADLEEAVVTSREINGYVMRDGEMLVDHRRKHE